MHTQLQEEERAAWMQIPLRATEAGKSAASDGAKADCRRDFSAEAEAGPESQAGAEVEVPHTIERAALRPRAVHGPAGFWAGAISLSRLRSSTIWP